MCLAIPMKVIEVIDDEWALVEIGGAAQKVNITLLDDLHPDDYVVVHAGFAIEKLDKERAEYIFNLLKKLEQEDISENS